MLTGNYPLINRLTMQISMYSVAEKRKTLLLHITGWCIFIIYIYTTNYFVDHNLKFIPTALFLIPHLSTFYIVLYFLNLNIGRKILWGIAVFFIVFIIMSAASYIFFYLFLPLLGFTLYYTEELRNFIQSAVHSYVQFFAFALLYYYFTGNTRKERELRIMQQENAKIEQKRITQERDNALLREQEIKARKEKLELEFAFLQSQINPHFLYNTLNVLFSQALKVSNELAENISKMSEIIRYSMESVEYKIQAVSLQKELEHLQILIDINSIRFGKSCFISYQVEGEAEGQLIPPLIFITVVENAFKYGDIRDSVNPLCIQVKLRPGHLYFYCRNKKKTGRISARSLNIGLKNLRHRLAAAFSDRYHIETMNEEEFYTFKLTINSM